MLIISDMHNAIHDAFGGSYAAAYYFLVYYQKKKKRLKIKEDFCVQQHLAGPLAQAIKQVRAMNSKFNGVGSRKREGHGMPINLNFKSGTCRGDEYAAAAGRPFCWLCSTSIVLGNGTKGACHVDIPNIKGAIC